MNEEQKRQIAAMYLDSDNIGAYGPVAQFHQQLQNVQGIDISLNALRTLLREQIPKLTINKEQQLRFTRRVQFPLGLDTGNKVRTRAQNIKKQIHCRLVGRPYVLFAGHRAEQQNQRAAGGRREPFAVLLGSKGELETVGSRRGGVSVHSNGQRKMPYEHTNGRR